ncbi:MAG: asparaginase [Lentihominibacter sp.]|jgi:L-asparaginase
MEERRKIRILTLGGTIAMKEDAHGQAKPAADGFKVVAQIKKYGDIGADVEVEAISNIPSSHLTVEGMLNVAKHIKELSDEGNTNGFVVTQGTDTQEETAYMLGLVLNIKQPVVITGAMRNGSEPSYDGIINVRNACRAAADPASQEHGVMLYCNDYLHEGKYVTKTHTSNVATFQSPIYGPVGMVEKHKVLYFRKSTQLEHFPIPDEVAEVAVIKCVAGIKDYLIEACIDVGVRGIVIEGLGRGHVPPGAIPAIKEAVKEGIPCVLCSRCESGFVLDAYSHIASAKHMKDIGMIFGTDLSGQKARLKLIAILGQTNDMEKICKLFERGIYD